MLEQYKDEQNKAEMKILNEVAGQKYYAKMLEKSQEEMLEELELEELKNEN